METDFLFLFIKVGGGLWKKKKKAHIIVYEEDTILGIWK